MRERLVTALVGLTIAMILLYGAPRAYVLADLIEDQEQGKVDRSADLVSVFITDRERNDEPVDEALLEPLLGAQAGITYVAPDGTGVQAGPRYDDEGDLVAERQVEGGGTLTYARAGDLVRDRVAEALWPLLTVGLVLIALSAVFGWLLARHLSRPFGELARAADRLGRGRFDLEVPTYGIPEARRIGSALNRAASQLDDLLTREREFASNASHQLRTPITALRLTLEDVSMWEETPATVATELTATLDELDRLSDAVTELLSLSRGRRVGDAVDLELSALVSEVVERWRPTLDRKHRRIVHNEQGTVVAHAAPGPVQQVLDVLIDNACAYGRGTVTVTALGREEYVALAVSDEGPLTIDNEVFRRGTSESDGQGHGLGLAIASQLAASMGGELMLADRPSTTFVLVLPVPGGELPDVLLEPSTA